MMKPEQEQIFLFTELIASCSEYIDWLDSEDFHPDKMEKFENQIYEAALNSVYGVDVFNYINSKVI